MERKRSLGRVRPPAAGTLAAALPCGDRGRCAVVTAYGDLAAVGEPHEAGGDNALARANAGLDHGLRLILLRHDDRTHRGRVVVLDHVDEGAVRTALHRAGWDRHHAFQGIDQQPDIDELARPKRQAGIGKLGLELHGTGGLVDLIVHHAQGAAVEYRVTVWLLRFDG